MKKNKIIAIILIIILSIGIISYITFISEIRESEIQEHYNKDNKEYAAKITFKIHSFSDISDINVYAIYPDAKVDVKKGVQVGKKLFEVEFTKKLTNKEEEQYYKKRPEYLVTWVENDKKRVSYIYHSNAAPPFLIR